MPCRSDYMEPTEREKESGRISLLLEELESGQQVDPDEYKRVYKYDVSQQDLDVLTEKLCIQMQLIEAKDLPKFSLELQMWWRDHQETERRRWRRSSERSIRCCYFECQ